jgi:farnesyl diphosphate synthase
MDMNPLLKSEIDKIAFLVEKEMGVFLSSSTAEESILFDSMRYSSLAKAKRLRAFLVVESAKLFGVNIKQAIKIACAVEFVHAYSLIHDDLPAMDNSSTRRGKPSNHVQFDEATAILAGDALIPLAFEVISSPETVPDAETRCDLVQELSKAIGPEGMVAGQFLDLLSERRPLSFRTMNRMQDLKTGRMFIFSCMAGAILGKADNMERKALYEYARNLGAAFQITDDILDVEGDERLVGKPLRRDKVSNKTTFISLYGINQAKSEAEALIERASKSLDIFEEDTTLLKDLAGFLLIRTH